MSHTMAIEYVIRNSEGEEVARFQDPSEARRYDRVLTAAEQLFDMFRGIPALSGVEDSVMDEVSFQIAKRSGDVIPILSKIGREKTPQLRNERKGGEPAVPAREETDGSVRTPARESRKKVA